MGFVNGTTDNYDRLLYVGTNGELYAGIYPSSAEEINSTQTVNNGVWHTAVLTQSSAGLFLYLDGSLVASNAAYTTAETATSYWDIGYSYGSGWTNEGSAYFTGDIAEAAVLPTALTSTQVATLASYGTGNGNVTSSIGIGTSSPTANLDDAGTALFQAPTNSTTAFQIQNASGAKVLSVDTTDGYVYIGNGSTGEGTAKLLVLDSETGGGAEPTEVNGGMYYNASVGAFRCGVGGVWVSCVAANNASTASQTVTTTTTAYLNGSAISIPAGGLHAGTQFTWRIALSKSASGTATPSFIVKYGTAGTTADTSEITFTGPAETAATDTGYVTINVTVQSVNSSTGTWSGSMTMLHDSNEAGLIDVTQNMYVADTTSGSFNDTTSGAIVGIAVTAGASNTFTVQQVQTNTAGL
jgi:hypothetical protein